MKLTITSISLRSPLHFFALSWQAFRITAQLKASPYKGFRKRGIWTTHYTMTLWENESDLKGFAQSGAHLQAMKKTKQIAREIRTITVDADDFPGWEEAKKLLEDGKAVVFL
ncbi:hypothetical protein ADIS_1192 [Lunatimonas lonarensis]|uniref:Uncharacterized protein n=1 Tax=Lunatimonas lonarensis TaxID=1232681 RepID=R7ZWF0_9BACT|nr:DUF3291 domain-containing protein [Lunatimonas lonarensis]EON78329.1 hypothetical protein ADIS_1192 [Lunatimonas lonarensis]